jgi:hypothetical protein
MRDLPGLLPVWAKAVVVLWAITVVAVLALLVARLVVGRH